MENKRPWMSKTIWASFLVGISGFFPPVREWVMANPESFNLLLGLVFSGLRLVTDKGLKL